MALKLFFYRADLIGPALDWAVERALGTHWSVNGYFVYNDGKVVDGLYPFSAKPRQAYSIDWSQGGPILERECIVPGPRPGYRPAGSRGFEAHRACVLPSEQYRQIGPTYLIAGMRCFVASKLGEEVDIPEELI